MAIDFERTLIDGVWHITSPQIPGWSCTASTQEAANAQIKASLRAHLRYAQDLSPGIRRAIEAFVLG